MSNKKRAIQQITFTLRKDQTLDAVLGLPGNDIGQQPQQRHRSLSWNAAMLLLRCVRPQLPEATVAPTTNTVLAWPATAGASLDAKGPATRACRQARWRWAQPLVDFLCK